MTRKYQELRDQMSPERRAAVDARVQQTLAEMAEADPVLLGRSALEDLRDNLAQLRDRVLANEGRPSADVIAARLTFVVTQCNTWLALDPLHREPAALAADVREPWRQAMSGSGTAAGTSSGAVVDTVQTSGNGPILSDDVPPVGAELPAQVLPPLGE